MFKLTNSVQGCDESPAFFSILTIQKESVTKHLKQACCKRKTNELRRIDSEVFGFTDMLVYFGTDYADIKIEAGLMSQPLFLQHIPFLIL